MRAAERFNRIGVLIFAGELIFVCGFLCEGAHRAARLIGILKAIEEHMVIGGVMADARTAAMLFKDIGRVGHALHAARDDIVDRAGGDGFCAHDHGLHATAAYLVDGGGLH